MNVLGLDKEVQPKLNAVALPLEDPLCNVLELFVTFSLVCVVHE